MDKVTQLLIRACKSKNPRQRLYSVYRRFYLNSKELHRNALITILADICDEYTPFSTIKLISEIHPMNVRWKYGGEVPFEEACFITLMNKIRLSEVNCFPGLTPPLSFKN